MNIIPTELFLNINSKIKILFIFSLFFNLNIYGQNLNNGGTIGYNSYICPGETPQTFINLTYPSGGGSDPIQYLWITTSNPSQSISNWNSASGVNDEESYSPPPTGITTYYIRCARREGFNNYTAETSIVSVTVLTNPSAHILDNPGSSTVGSEVDFSAAISTNSSYSWDFDEDGIIDCTGQNCSNTFTSPGTYTISLTVNNGSCSITTTEEITIVPSVVIGDNPCSCNNNQDFSNGDGYFIHDYLHITSGPSEIWQILGINSGAIYNGSATPIVIGTDIPELVNMAGSYYLSFWFKSGEGYDINLSNGDNLISAETIDPCNCLIALPVEMVSFEAILNEIDKAITLKWTTLSESNNSHFELQRSLDGSRFDYLKVIGSQGNSNLNKSYSFVDKNPVPGVNYYRLKQVDFDGTQTYSNIVSAKISTKSVIASVIPNPVNEKAIVRFGEKLPKRAKLQILSSLGQVLDTYLVENTLSQEINLDRYEKGVYFLRIKNADRREKAFFKIVKF